MPESDTNQALGPTRTMLSIQATPDIDNIRTDELFGQDHTVIPAIAIVEGVLWAADASGPELALAEEFGRYPEGWDGRPVVFGHPKIDGIPVPANTPELLESNALGQLFNTTLEDGKLKTEIWINKALVEKLDEEAQQAVENLTSGEGIVEVSTGLFLQRQPAEGEFNGEPYESIWRNIVPDHFAILPEGITGACSVEDGCGAPRTNQMVPVMRAAELITTECTCTDSTHEHNQQEQEGIFKRLLNIAGGILRFTSNDEHLSDTDLRAALNMALGSIEEDRFFFILAVYPEANDSGTFVYELGFDGKLFERTFSISEGSITIGADSVAVRPITTFVPVEVVTSNEANSTTQENDMNVEELVNALIANEGTQWNEDDREWLGTLEETQLSKMAPSGPTEEELAAIAAAEAQARGEGNGAPMSTDEFIAQAPAEIQAVLESGVQMHRDRKAALVAGLLANSRNRFSKEDLKAKSIKELNNIAALSASDVSYIGAGANLSNQQEDENAAPMPQVFDLSQASA